MERNKVRSLRGEMVNFDLFAIKEQMSEAPITTNIQQRERFVHMKKRRGTRKVLNNLAADMEAPVVEEAVEQAPEGIALADEAEPTVPRKIVKKAKE